MNEHARELGKLGGKSKSPAKIAAAKANGFKGGRPRKRMRPTAWIVDPSGVVVAWQNRPG